VKGTKRIVPPTKEMERGNSVLLLIECPCSPLSGTLPSTAVCRARAACMSGRSAVCVQPGCCAIALSLGNVPCVVAFPNSAASAAQRIASANKTLGEALISLPSNAFPLVSRGSVRAFCVRTTATPVD
jgi:hypothetical protein